MANEWEVVQVREIADSISVTHSRTKEKLVFLNTSDVLLGKVLHQTYTDVRDWPGQAKKSIRRDDILLSEIRPANGRWAYIDFDPGDFVVSTKLMVIRAKVDRVFPRFLYHFLTCVQTIEWLQHLAESRSGTFPQITFDQVAELKLSLPPRGDQEAIARFLDCIDGKIELNRKQSETLEAMARALFKSWFVDFEPVRAKQEGRWQRGQSLPGLPAQLYDFFPDRLVESEFGDVPEGWVLRSLDSIANYLNGLALQKFPPESETEFLPVIKIAQLRAGNTNGADKASAQIKPEYVVVDGDVLFSWSGSLEVEVWNGGRGALNQHLFKVTSNDVPKWFYFFATRHHLSDFRAIAAGKATTMGHIQRKHLTDARIAVAPPESMKRFDAVIASQFDQLVSNAQQSRSLAQLRDTLLPKLISGELRVGNADRYLRGIA